MYKMTLKVISRLSGAVGEHSVFLQKAAVNFWISHDLVILSTGKKNCNAEVKSMCSANVGLQYFHVQIALRSTNSQGCFEYCSFEYKYEYEYFTDEYEYEYEYRSHKYEYEYEYFSYEYKYEYEYFTDEYEYEYRSHKYEYEYFSYEYKYEYEYNTVPTNNGISITP